MTVITFADWKNQTSHTWKSSAYKTLSKAFEAWQNDQTKTKLETLAQAFSAWQTSKIGNKLDTDLKQSLVSKQAKTQYVLDHHQYNSKRNKIKGNAVEGPMERLAETIATAKGSNQAIQIQSTGSTLAKFDPVKRSQINHSTFNKATRMRIEEAIRRTRQGISLVMEELPKAKLAGTAERTRYVTWFGAYDQVRYTKVLKNFQILLDVITNSNFQFDQDTGPNNDYYAATLPGNRTGADDIQIDLGTAFFNGAGKYDKSTSATVGTMVHELTHGCFYTYDMYLNAARTSARTDEDPPNGGFGGWDLCNDPDNDKDLAIHFPNDALRNADNYGEYAAAVVSAHEL